MSLPVSLSKNNNIAVISIHNPPINALSQSVRQGIADCVERAENDDSINAIIISCKDRTFVAGADISEFGKPSLEPHLPDVLRLIDRCKKPIVASLFGTTLGGGFELALSCHYRIALKGTKVGFPEVKLGLIPGAGGTQLLPRIAGVKTALEMITSGKPETVENLLQQKVIDQIVDNQLLEHSLIFAQSLIKSDKDVKSVSKIVIEKGEQYEELFEEYRRKLNKKARGQIAPQYAIDSIKNAVTRSFDDGMKRERKMFLECRSSSQSKALQYAFFAEREASKLSKDNEGAISQDINSVGIIGAGTMGGGIAMCFAAAGIPVKLLEVNEEYLQRGLGNIYKHFQQNLHRKRISEQQHNDCVNLIEGTCDYQDLANVDLVIEAAFENMDIKHKIFSRLDEVCKKDTILASNTSYLDINQIALATNRPEKVLGMHFFSPANIMKLLEVIRTDKTDDQSLKSVMNLGKKIGKIAVPVNVCYGFVGNRMYACYGREAQMLLLEGATPQQIDSAMEAWGMAMGPLSVNDLSGIDIGYKARRENLDLPKDPCYFRPADLMVENGRLGQKSGAGFYLYDKKTGKKSVDEKVVEMIRFEANKLGISQRNNISDEEIQNRLISVIANEGKRIIEEGIARRASDIDVIWLNGYGFPRFRGGPMYYSDDLLTV